jgi:predicted LPLAT superfamily acyltransferase
VASPAYLAAMKMVARRTKDEADLEALIDSGELDLNEARQVVQRLLGDYAADDLESYIQTSPLRRRKE